ncbi:MAG: 4a-hydroxytetrahydrobiopterin dehydratase [Jatrophihabitans sp.]|uniref:4a-hydroxytetrahydrobiopterin dehydratase n=1 Tax=Jatrophihabitans sp. TaxID=1932789 RepID=UPI003F81320A
MSSRPAPLTDDQLAAALAERPGWTGSAAGLQRTIEFADFLTAVRFIDELAPHCERLDHHPDLRLSWRRVELTLVTHSTGGVTALDVELAAVVDDVAAALPLAS